MNERSHVASLNGITGTIEEELDIYQQELDFL